AGVRSSRYGIRPFPSPEGWLKAMKTMAGYFEGSSPAAIWIVGELYRPKDVQLDFPGGEKPVPRVKFGDADLHEAFLTVFDEAGVKIFLQVEPAHADVETLIDLVLGRYRHHACVAGFGIDVEWLREADFPGRGSPVSDEEARTWEARVKSWNPGYRLFLKHWNPKWMPATYRGDIIFVDDSQIFESREEMIREFTEGWAPAFYPNPVVFQIGYGSDKPWWSKLETPPRDLGEAIRAGVKQDMGIIWVDFTLRDVLPEED
ncbi:MAG: hypothetical protein H6P98_2952, partial [Candidatus Aminicenantes bacterium]|nr:hypothetical protein [Candidatus Aminicenantes bacterium]